MPVGGRRPGAGRKAGVTNAETQLQRDVVQAAYAASGERAWQQAKRDNQAARAKARKERQALPAPFADARPPRDQRVAAAQRLVRLAEGAYALAVRSNDASAAVRAVELMWNRAFGRERYEVESRHAGIPGEVPIPVATVGPVDLIFTLGDPARRQPQDAEPEE